MKTVDLFLQEQKSALKRLQDIEAWLVRGKSFGLSLDELLDKVNNSRKGIEEGRIRIALLGGFSEGKTSVLAAWLGNVEEGMEIAFEESSDAVRSYEITDGLLHFEIVDTPGLFGYKSKVLDDGELKSYEAISKKYISEAHIVLCVLNPVNPLKASHREVVQWLFRELNMLDRSVFVFNKFDEVCDLEDEADYQALFEIKRSSFLHQLDDFIHLSDMELEKLQVVAVSANPYNKGVEYWLNHSDLYEELSRMPLLQNATSRMIELYEGRLLTAQVESVLYDILRTDQAIFDDLRTQYVKEKELRQEAIERLRDQILQANRMVDEKRKALKLEVKNYFISLVHEVEQLTENEWDDFIASEIGGDGAVLSRHLEDVFGKYISQVNSLVDKSVRQVLKELDFRDTLFEKYFKQFVGKGMIFLDAVPTKYLEKSISTVKNWLSKGNSSTLKKGVAEVGKASSNSVLKLAKGIQNSLVVLGAAMELYDVYSKERTNSKFSEAKVGLIHFLRTQERDVLESVTSREKFSQLFLPEYQDLIDTLKKIELASDELEVRSKAYEKWLKEGSIILS